MMMLLLQLMQHVSIIFGLIQLIFPHAVVAVIGIAAVVVYDGGMVHHCRCDRMGVMGIVLSVLQLPLLTLKLALLINATTVRGALHSS